VQPQQQPRLRHGERAERPRREPGGTRGGGPRLEPPRVFADAARRQRQRRVDLSAEDLVLHQETVSAARRHRRLQGVEHRRVVAHRGGHPPRQVVRRGAVVVAADAAAGFLLGDGHHGGVHGLDPLQERGDLALAAEPVQEEDAVDGQRLVRVQLQPRGRVSGELRGAGEEERVETEGEVEGAGEGAETVAGAEEHVAVGPSAGDPDLGRADRRVRAVGDGLQQRRPLHAVRGVEVHDVQPPRAAAGGGVQDRLVGRQVREPEERRDLVVRQVRRRRRCPSRGRGRRGDAASERAGEVVREAVGRVTPRVGGGQDLVRRAPGAVDVAAVDEAGGREHEASGRRGLRGGVLVRALRGVVAVVARCAEHGGVRARWAQGRMARAG